MKKHQTLRHLLTIISLSLFIYTTSSHANTIFVEEFMVSDKTEWTSAFDINVTANEVIISIKISLLTPKGIHKIALEEKSKLWIDAINRIWGNRFYTTIEGKNRPIRINAKFTHNKPHHRVVVHPGQWSPNQHNWYLNTPPPVVAHEIGHMLGAYDEYRGGALSPDTPVIDTTSIMGSRPIEGVTYPRHLSLIEGKLIELSANKKLKIMKY